MKKYSFSVAAVAAAMFLGAYGFASAHVTVKPGEVKIGAFTDFSVGVPVEKDVPTIGIRLVIPEGLESISPHLKPGWKIDIKRGAAAAGSEHGAEGPVTEISWTGNEIPAGFKDLFTFSAKAPSKAGSVQWKAYQTYKDGTIVSWDASAETQPKGPDGKPDFSKVGPYSETKIIDDLAQNNTEEQEDGRSRTESLTLGLSLIAIIAAGYSIYKK